MEIKLIQTVESDGNWYKVYVGEQIKACVKIYPDKEGEAFNRAKEIFDFYVENKGEEKVILTETIWKTLKNSGIRSRKPVRRRSLTGS